MTNTNTAAADVTFIDNMTTGNARFSAYLKGSSIVGYGETKRAARADLATKAAR